jgi:hypothetical protein
VNLSATVFDAGGITYRRWSVVERPFGSFDEPFNPELDSSFFYPDLFGSFRVRYRAADDLFQLSACDVSFQLILGEQFRVEMIWNGDKLQHEHISWLEMHLLHPTAQRWFQETLDCSTEDCMYQEREWGDASDELDNPYFNGLFLGPQWVSVPFPQYNGTYGVGVHYDYFNYLPATPVKVSIFCNGVLQYSADAVLVNGDNENFEDNDFWKVAEVDLAASGCSVIPYANGGGPLITTIDNAQNAR